MAGAGASPVNGAAPDREGRELEAEMARVAARVQSIAARRPLTPEEEASVFEQTAGLRGRLARMMQRRLVEDRPEVVSRGRPSGGEQAHRGLEKARETLRELPAFRRHRPTCPAANVLARGAVRCPVEHSTLDPHDDPMSLATFCYGNHTACPTWRAEVDARHKTGKSLEVGAP